MRVTTSITLDEPITRPVLKLGVGVPLGVIETETATMRATGRPVFMCLILLRCRWGQGAALRGLLGRVALDGCNHRRGVPLAGRVEADRSRQVALSRVVDRRSRHQ